MPISSAQLKPKKAFEKFSRPPPERLYPQNARGRNHVTCCRIFYRVHQMNKFRTDRWSGPSYSRWFMRPTMITKKLNHFWLQLLRFTLSYVRQITFRVCQTCIKAFVFLGPVARLPLVYSHLSLGRHRYLKVSSHQQPVCSLNKEGVYLCFDFFFFLHTRAFCRLTLLWNEFSFVNFSDAD